MIFACSYTLCEAAHQFYLMYDAFMFALQELEDLDAREIWQAGKAVRQLRPENQKFDKSS